MKYNYESIVQLALKYNCEILDSQELIESKPDLIKIKSKCGHNTMSTFNQFIKHKIGVYCKECMGRINLNDNNMIIQCANSKCKKNC